MTSPSRPRSLIQKVWDGSIPLEIRLASEECRTFDQADPYLIQCPRLSYWPFLLPRLHSFFASYLINPDVSFSEGWLSFEDVPLKWQYPIGLLYDLYSGTEPFRAYGDATVTTPKHDAEDADGQEHVVRRSSRGRPWRLVLHFTQWPTEQLVTLDGEGKNLQDAYINAVKEADFLRNGNAKVVMSLSKDDSTLLWSSVQDHALQTYLPIYQKFLRPPGANLRHIPLKFYLPAAASATASTTSNPTPGTVKIVQTLVTPNAPGSRSANTLGITLNTVLPTLFPSRRRSLLAEPVLHGALVPLGAPVEELLKDAAYADGWLHIVIVMMS